MNQRLSFLMVALFTLSFTMLFQNCGKVGFQNAATPMLVASDKVSSSSTTDFQPGSDVPTTDFIPPVTENPAPTPSPTHGKVNDDDDDSNSGNLIECQVGGSNMKVALANSLQAAASNSVKTRVCMSENACLNLINAYVQVRGGKLQAGAPSTSSVGSCTKIFPGSKGTCKNAAVATDAQIVNILSEMGHK